MNKNQNSISKLVGLLNISPEAWGLRRKILLSMITLLLLLGLTTALITRMILLRVLKTEFQHRGLSSARSLAASGVVDILTQNTSRLNQLVENEKKLDNDIAYIFIIDSSSRILAHTFNKGFPVDLLKANKVETGQDANIQALDTQKGLIYDIAVPVFLEKKVFGQIRLGVLQNNIKQTIAGINFIVIGATLFIVFIGILLAYKISSLITQPISKLVQATQSIQEGNFSVEIDINTQDEIGLLASAFKKMVFCLNHTVDQMKHLSAAKERNRIALDLHDDRAQNLASIIKRIELCEKLFKRDPEKALEELGELKNVARDILDKTRRVIFDLKLPTDINFDLVESLSNYITNYRKQTDIHITVDIPGPLKDISSDKSKQIFYIITEALTNIKKHSAAENVIIYIGCDNHNELTVHIKDDGQGFDINEAEIYASDREKFGIIGMQKRAASIGGVLSIRSKVGEGSDISLSVSLKDKQT